ncbi:cytosine permease [Agrobacterium tumefaciens]|nr:cytosine permease [Agrobacterium tumefaciens]NSZ02078.1 cytosine permease [Agrobacterium tumefaciens]NTB05705.1 cytosine permease [Agrobacterium tumefaciens]NTB21804.1 cytosine permease [Agrobacterium tumefaciens]NTB29550.1 cytosine permease [Agrobacterium tumefaciens]NTB34530.1 cytosine permease [Agrobacterium tumefaciens]
MQVSVNSDIEQRPAIARNALAIEHRSIDYVPLSERHGRLSDQATIWFAGSAQLLSLATGAIGITLGLNLLWTLIGLLVGTILGTIPVAAHASQGPHLGLPQMVQTRPQFGRHGAIFIWLVAVLVYWGYVVLNVNLMGATAEQLGLGSASATGVVLGVVSIVFAIFGYHWLHVGQRYTTVVLLVVLAVFTLGVVFGAGFPSGQIALTGTFQFTPFLMVVSASLAYQLSWAFFVSDYSRYMPPTTSHRSIILFTAFGAGAGVFSMEAVGAVGAALFPKDSLTLALQQSGDQMFPGFGAILLVVGGVALLIFNGMCVYGGALTLITAMDSVVVTSPTRKLRIKTIAAIGITATIVGVMLPTDFINTTFYTILAVLAYLMAPWTAVNLVDYFVVRKGRYSISEIFNPKGIYGNWNWRGMAAYTLAFFSMIPFMYLSFYQGPVAIYLGGVDFAFFVGIPVGAILYWLFCLNLDLKRELAIIATADKDLDVYAKPVV